jgi:hypothetical protein
LVTNAVERLVWKGNIAADGCFVIHNTLPGGRDSNLTRARLSLPGHVARLNGLGSLLFAAGFAIHGMRASRISSRHSELEMLVRAQTEEIRRLSSQAP